MLFLFLELHPHTVLGHSMLPYAKNKSSNSHSMLDTRFPHCYIVYVIVGMCQLAYSVVEYNLTMIENKV